MNLQSLQSKYQALITQAKSLAELEQLERQLFHKKTGELAIVLRTLKELSVEERKQQGEAANQVKTVLLTALAQAKQPFAGQITAIDTTLPGLPTHSGHIHPLRLIQEELVDVFRSMSFTVFEGNERETEDYCFEFLNIPATHPARDLQDTFYLDSKREDGMKEVMRTHTSNMQVRIMQQFTPPLRVVVPGRVFRNEAVDASHEHTFYQMEGFVVDQNISIAQLTYMLRLAMSKILKTEVKIRLRPGYFPYVEPGFEADCSCTQCAGKGCAVCKYTGWV